MPLYTIFWGSYWATPDGQAQQAALENSLNTMFFFNATLSGLKQYGVPFPAGVPGSGTVEVNDFSDPANGFSKSNLDDVVSNAIDNLGLPEEDDFSNGGFYLVFTPPNISSGNGGRRVTTPPRPTSTSPSTSTPGTTPGSATSTARTTSPTPSPTR